MSVSFTNKYNSLQIQCTYVFILLSLLRIKCAELHSDKSQDERTSALECFKKEEVDVLICTEVAARGIHIEGVNTVSTDTTGRLEIIKLPEAILVQHWQTSFGFVPLYQIQTVNIFKNTHASYLVTHVF